MDEHRKLLKLYNVPGHVHFLTFSCNQRHPYLDHDLTRSWLAMSVNQACTKYNYDLWAYVFMPEHVHLLVNPRVEEYSIGKFLYAVKFPVTYHAVRYRMTFDNSDTNLVNTIHEVQEKSTFWQNGPGYDRNLWSNDEIVAKLDYIHRNPVKRGLVAHGKEWEWSSAGEYDGIKDERVVVTPIRLD